MHYDNNDEVNCDNDVFLPLAVLNSIRILLILSVLVGSGNDLHSINILRYIDITLSRVVAAAAADAAVDDDDDDDAAVDVFSVDDDSILLISCLENFNSIDNILDLFLL
jgi:hypothetical protein